MLNAARWTVFSMLGLALLALAFTVGYVVASEDSDSNSEPPRSSAGEGELDFSALNEILEILRRDYVEPDRVDPETMYEGAINGLLESVKDTGTFYVDPRTYRTTIGPEGTFDGIGATVAEQNGEIVIVAPIEGTPAERAGLQRGDVILEVDGESTKGWTVEEAVLRIRGERGTTVTLKIRHPDGSEEVVTIERAEIKVESVTTIPPGGELKNAAGQTVTDIGYIQIREFNRPTEGEVERAIQELREAGARGIILDLRNNPGGLLETTVNIADMFLDGGTILYEEHKDGAEQVYQAREGGPATDIPVVILLNQFSASGSEVLAAALRDNGRATIVGEKSFGKGTVNVPRELSDGGALFVTIARWLTPKRVQIDGVGIAPDVQVTLSDEDIDLRRDAQLFRAIDLLEGMVRSGVIASSAR